MKEQADRVQLVGLTSPEALASLEQAGPNELQTEAVTPAWRRVLAQFKDALVLLLLAAAAVSCAVWAVERETNLPYEGLEIITIVLLNAIPGFVQEGKAEKALAALQSMAAPEAGVVRDGKQDRVAARELVPGDLLALNEGDTVSADARLIEVVELQTLEAPLTGESVPVYKEPATVDPGAGIGDRLNMVFAGRRSWTRPRDRDRHRDGNRVGQDCRHVEDRQISGLAVAART